MLVEALYKRHYVLTLRLLLRWRQWLFVIIPICLSPILIVTHGSLEGRGAFGVLWVILYWMFTVVPLPITGLFPAVVMPLLGIVKSKELAMQYMVDINLLLLASMTAAIGIEISNLHRRIALRTLMALGTSPRRLLLAFMLPSMFLSLWINNTSACALMVPIADVVLIELYPEDKDDATTSMILLDHSVSQVSQLSQGYIKERRNTRVAIMLGIAYSCNLGGIGTITGTGTNLILLGFMEKSYHSKYVPNYLNWMLFNIPIVLVCIFITWLVLLMCFWGPRSVFKWQRRRRTRAELNTRRVIEIKYREMGKISYHEVTILLLFGLLIMLWMFRNPGYMLGWSALFSEVKISDTCPAILIVMMMFFLPAQKDIMCANLNDLTKDIPPPRALNWKAVQLNLAWSVLIVMGGGFALAHSIKAAGLSTLMSKQLLFLKDFPVPAMLLICMLLSFLLTSVTSNTATVTILLPVLMSLAETLKYPPLQLLLPTTVASSWAFMLPISTPPNAIAYERGRMRPIDMCIPGSILGAIFMCFMLGMMMFYAPIVFPMEYTPLLTDDN